MDLFDASQQDVSYHIGQIYEDGEQDQERTLKKFLIVRQEGNRSVRRHMLHYNLDMIVAVGFRVKLIGNGSITHEQAKKKAIAEFEKYRKLEMLQYESDYDRAVKELIQKEKSQQEIKKNDDDGTPKSGD